MILSGIEMYDLNGRKVIIDQIKEDTIHATLIREVVISYNDNKSREKQVIKKSVTYDFNELGIRLFFSKDDIVKHKLLQINDKRYKQNFDNIYSHFKNKFDEKAIEIKEDKPIGPILTLALKEKIINDYYDYSENIKTEEIFHKKNTGCFGRIDLDTEYYREYYENYHKKNYYDIVYISKGQYRVDGNIHIVNWRSPIASLFYDNKNTKLTLKGYVDTANENHRIDNPLNVYNYELMLKREYSFNPLKYVNTYIAGDDFYLEGTIDSFLLEVLEENRANNAITDIIRSIQSNQYKIIRHTENRNMIVQGCAGSGKTMILLHRISYLLFNGLLINTSEVKIITPNENFSEFINDLVYSLEIGEIERTTMSNYYLSIIRRYQNRLSTYLIGEMANKKEIEFNKKALSYAFDISDKFPKEYNEIFEKGLILDKELFNKIELQYEGEIRKICEDINDIKVFEIANRLRVEFDKSIIYGKKDYFDNIYYLCSKDILSVNEKVIDKINNVNSIINKFETLSNDVKIVESYISIIKTENNKLEHLSNVIKTLIDLNKEYELKNHHLSIINDEYQENTNKLENKIRKSFIPFGRNRIKSKNDEITDRYLKEKSEIEKELDSINNEFINLVTEFTDIKENLSFDDYLNIANEVLSETNNNVNKKILEIKKMIINKINSMIVELKTIKFNSNYFDGKEVLEAKNQINELLDKLLYALDDIKKDDIIKCNELINKIQKINQEELTNLFYQEKELTNTLLSYEEKSLLVKVTEKLYSRKMLVINIYEKIRDDIREDLSINSDKNAISKSEIIILVYLYYLHCGELSIKDSFIFIDEGQDYSIMEYKLLQLVNGKKCLFNIFGDVKQLLNNNGIENWAKMKEIISYDYYELQENYRNTVEITNFVNQKFDYKLFPIGVHGPDVQYILSSQMLGIIKEEMKNDPKNRIAVIVKNKVSKKINDKYKDKIFYYNVKEVKGLEFDIAFVILEGMSDNEEYISYTRALNKLYIVK